MSILNVVLLTELWAVWSLSMYLFIELLTHLRHHSYIWSFIWAVAQRVTYIKTYMYIVYAHTYNLKELRSFM